MFKTADTPLEPIVYTAQQTAYLMNVSKHQILEMIRRKELRAFKISNKYMVPAEAIHEFIRQRLEEEMGILPGGRRGSESTALPWRPIQACSRTAKGTVEAGSLPVQRHEQAPAGSTGEARRQSVRGQKNRERREVCRRQKAGIHRKNGGNGQERGARIDVPPSQTAEISEIRQLRHRKEADYETVYL